MLNRSNNLLLCFCAKLAKDILIAGVFGRNRLQRHFQNIVIFALLCLGPMSTQSILDQFSFFKNFRRGIPALLRGLRFNKMRRQRVQCHIVHISQLSRGALLEKLVFRFALFKMLKRIVVLNFGFNPVIFLDHIVH